MLPESYSLILCFFVVALLYASVGHGGASGYLAVMSLFEQLDLVTREEFDAQVSVLQRSREKIDRLEREIQQLQQRLHNRQ